MRACSEYEGLYRVIVPQVAFVILLNAVTPLPLLVLMERFINPGSGGLEFTQAIVCYTIWIALMVALAVLALLVMLWKDAGEAVIATFLAWPMALLLPAMSSWTTYIVIASIPPAVLTALVIRMVWLIYMIERTRPLPIAPEYPLSR